MTMFCPLPSLQHESMLAGNILMWNWYKIIMHSGDEAMEACAPENDSLECNDLLATKDQAR